MSAIFQPTWSVVCGAALHDVALSDAAPGRSALRVVVGSEAGCHVLDGNGETLWTKPGAPCQAVAVSADSRLIAAGYAARTVLYEERGKELWQTPRAPLRQGLFLLAERAALVLATAEAIHYLPFDGERRPWQFAWPQVRSLQVAPAAFVRFDGTGSAICAGTAEGEILVLDEAGQLLDRLLPGGEIAALTVTADGQALVALDRQNNKLHCYDGEGVLVWQRAIGEPGHPLALLTGTVNGELLACHQDRNVWLLSRTGDVLRALPTEKPVAACALERNGQGLALGDHTGQLTWLVAAQEAAKQEPIRQIRQSYLLDHCHGICLWLLAFDSALAAEQLDFCESLLHEIKNGYVLSPFEQDCFHSRRGAWLLSCGLVQQADEAWDDARACYQQALGLFQQVRDFYGETQARLQLAQLDERVTAPSTRQAPMKVLGSAEALLARQVEHGSLPEQVRAVQLAQQFGYLEPLLKALDGADIVAQQAAAALGGLHPGPTQAALQSAARHANWFVRWRAAALLRQRAETTASPGAAAWASGMLLTEDDPIVRRTWLRVLEQQGDHHHTTLITALLRDPDADVRHAACRALAKIGDERAIGPLRQVEPGYAYFDRSSLDNGWVEKIAQAALEQVRQRPLEPSSCNLEFYRPCGSINVPTTAFPISVTAVIARLRADSGVSEISLADTSSWLTERQFCLSLTLPLSTALTPLVELLPEMASVPHTVENAVSSPAVSLQPPAGWQAGLYELDLMAGGELAARYCFEIIDSTPIEHIALFTADNQAANAPLVVLTGRVELQARVTLVSFAGLHVKGHIANGEGAILACTRNYSTGETPREIVLRWPALELPSGSYEVLITTETGQSQACHFRVKDVVPSPPAQTVASQLPAAAPTPQANNVARLLVELTPPPDDVAKLRQLRRVSGAGLRLPGRATQAGNFPVPPAARTRPSLGHGKLTTLFHPWQRLLLAQWIVAVSFFWLQAWLVRWVAGSAVTDSARLLALGSWLGSLTWSWWLLLGALYGCLLILLRWQGQRRAERQIRLLMIAAAFALLAHQSAYLIFGAGSIWPDFYGGFWGKLLFWRAFFAWAATGAMLTVCLNYQAEDLVQLKGHCLGLLFSLAFTYLVGALAALVLGSALWAVVAVLSPTWAQHVWKYAVPALFALGVGSHWLNVRKQLAKGRF